MIPPKRPLDDRLRALFAGNRPIAPRDVTAGPSGTTPAAGSLPGLWQGVRSNPVSEMALGMLPGVGQAMDVQDFAAAQREGSPLGMALAAAGAVPVAGDVVKGLAKGGRKVAQAVGALPMDEASRMARAAEQGFTRDVYHGTRAQDIEAMRPSEYGLVGPAVYTTPDPTLAGEFAQTFRASERSGAPNVLPLKARVKNPIVVSSPSEFWDKYQRVGQSENEVIAELQSLGHDGVVLRRPEEVWNEAAQQFVPTGKMQEYVAVFDPKNIRSRFARFDPAQAGSSNLMAGLAGILATGAAATNRREERP